MGKNDIAVKQWLSAKDRFADLFNMLIFGGSTVVHPQDLEDMEGEADIFVPDKAGGENGMRLSFFLLSKYNGREEGVSEALDILDRQIQEFYQIYSRKNQEKE